MNLSTHSIGDSSWTFKNSQLDQIDHNDFASKLAPARLVIDAQNVTCFVKVVVAKKVKISLKIPVFLLDENYWNAQVIVSFPEAPPWGDVKFSGVLDESQKKFDCDCDVVSFRGRIGVFRLKISNATKTSFDGGLLVATCGGVVSDPFHFKFGRSK